MSLLSFLSFHVQSNWCFKSISSISVIVSKCQCFRGGSILFYLELLFLCRKLLFSPLFPLPRELCCIPTDLCLVFFYLLIHLTNYLRLNFRISWEITIAGCDTEKACLFQISKPVPVAIFLIWSGIPTGGDRAIVISTALIVTISFIFIVLQAWVMCSWIKRGKIILHIYISNNINAKKFRI